MKFTPFPPFGRLALNKNCISTRKIQGFSVSENFKTTCLTVSQALLSSKIEAKCKELAFFTYRNDAVARVLGCPPGPKKAQKACVGAIFDDFQRFWALFGLHRAPALTKLKNDPREPKNETQKPQRPRMIPKRPKMTPQEAQNEPQEVLVLLVGCWLLVVRCWLLLRLLLLLLWLLVVVVVRCCCHETTKKGKQTHTPTSCEAFGGPAAGGRSP